MRAVVLIALIPLACQTTHEAEGAPVIEFDRSVFFEGGVRIDAGEYSVHQTDRGQLELRRGDQRFVLETKAMSHTRRVGEKPRAVRVIGPTRDMEDLWLLFPGRAGYRARGSYSGHIEYGAPHAVKTERSWKVLAESR